MTSRGIKLSAIASIMCFDIQLKDNLENPNKSHLNENLKAFVAKAW